MIAERTGEAQKIIDQANEETGKLPGSCNAEFLCGDPAETILHGIEVKDIDLVTMGARGRVSISNLLPGSQSHKVISTTPCPVLWVR